MWWIIGGGVVVVFAAIVVLGVLMVGFGQMSEAPEEDDHAV